MKHTILILMALFVANLCFSQAVYAQDSTRSKHNKIRKRQRLQFVDKNGDGYNDSLPDDDGDGIPNSLDPDWQKMHKKGNHKKHARFIDLDGDGINDLLFSGEGSNKQNSGTGGQKPAGAMGDQSTHKQKGRHGQGKGRK